MTDILTWPERKRARWHEDHQNEGRGAVIPKELTEYRDELARRAECHDEAAVALEEDAAGHRRHAELARAELAGVDRAIVAVRCAGVGRMVSRREAAE